MNWLRWALGALGAPVLACALIGDDELGRYAERAVAELPGYLGFATIPGDVCAAAAAATPPAAGTPQQ